MERKAVFVLTPGRSGSSVFAQILSVLGLRLSENLISATEENPQGYFEDALIVQREKEFLRNLGLHPQLPLPTSCISSREAGDYVRFLKEYLEQQVSIDGIWVCKAPTLCSTLPLWQKAMRQSRVVPFYFLAVRNLSDTLASFLKLGDKKQWAEQTIFTRTVSVLQRVQSNLFIQHYERLFNDFEQVAHEIGAWLDLPVDQERIEQARQCLKPYLNRSQYQQATPDNPLLIQLYDYLSTCNGNTYDATSLLHYVTTMNPAFALGETTIERLLAYHKQLITQQEKKYIQLQKEKEHLIKTHSSELENCKERYNTSLQEIVKKHEAEKQEIEQRLTTDTSALCTLNASQENKLYALRRETQCLLQQNNALQQQLQRKQTEAQCLLQQLQKKQTEAQCLLQKKNALQQQLQKKQTEAQCLLQKKNALQRRLQKKRTEAQCLLQKKNALQQQLQKAQNAKQNQIKKTQTTVQLPKQENTLLSRKEKLKRKFKEHPYEFFRDSKNPLIRPLRIFFLFKKSK